jgi:FkbM family methyltransferase
VDASSPTHDLVYDVGMNRGEDTAYYLLRGYRVIGFEADPALAAKCRERFADALAAGRLTMIEGAITSLPTSTVPFFSYAGTTWNGIDSSVWGSTDRDRMARKHVAVQPREIAVPAVDFAACLSEHGVPHYLKVDIEGADRLCLEALRDLPERPPYLSIEAEQEDPAAARAELDLLEELGYHEFKAVCQIEMLSAEIEFESPGGELVRHRFRWGSSGPFGPDLPGEWQTRSEIDRCYRGALRRHRIQTWTRRRPLRRRLTSPIYMRFLKLGRYYDTHARLSPG